MALSPRPSAGRTARAVALGLGVLVAACHLAMGPVFCGLAAPQQRGALAARNGWRLDMMELGPKGIGNLVIHEGYWIGEVGFEKVLNKNGIRYRMRASSEELKAGIDVPPITQIGPLKIRLYEIFGGSGRMPGLKRPEGFRGFAGTAAWDQDLPKKGGYYLDG